MVVVHRKGRNTEQELKTGIGRLNGIKREKETKKDLIIKREKKEGTARTLLSKANALPQNGTPFDYLSAMIPIAMLITGITRYLKPICSK